MKLTAVNSCYEKPLKSEVFHENIDFDNDTHPTCFVKR